MPRVAVKIELTDEERTELEKNIKGHKVEKRLYIRSKIILLAAEGKECIEIAKILDVSEKTCRKWRNRFADKRLEGILDLERSGAPDTFTEAERLEIIRLACSPPEVPKNWTLAYLTELAKERIGRSISIETVRQILKSADKRTSVTPPSEHSMYIKLPSESTEKSQ
ncbi:helix-turn-helix domain-containing protein [Sporomusa malonica]|uniref:Homeodomain-like domain-containing protein n=1 Tax=Sporomusa malonica TaxID=112901 RepID=A0A1W2BEL5_9FIRM|nr:helix-turn-helix domain-containing protein [Sporomusa malonica]SMC71172.1 Homeodomain-like domain-containing protein [Sporomusa malonica]